MLSVYHDTHAIIHLDNRIIYDTLTAISYCRMIEARLSRVAFHMEWRKGLPPKRFDFAMARRRMLGCGRICRRLSRKWRAVIGLWRGCRPVDISIGSNATVSFSFSKGSRFFILIKVTFRGSDAQSEDSAEKIAGNQHRTAFCVSDAQGEENPEKTAGLISRIDI